MLGILIKLIGNGIALYITTQVVSGFSVDNFQALAISTIVVAVVNTFIRPILRFISLPITLVTFGLFAIVVNAGCLALSAWIVPGFHIDGIIPALIGAVVLSIVSTVIDFFTNRIGGGKSTPAPVNETPTES